MVWVGLEPVWLDSPLLTDELVGALAFKGLQPAGAVVGEQEGMQMPFQFISRGVVEGAYRRILDGPVHPLDLAVGPRVVWLGQPMLNAVGQADPVEAVHAGGREASPVGELQAIVGEHRVDLV